MSEANIVTVREDGVFYRASAAGGCQRALLAARSGETPKPPPPDFSNPDGTGYFDIGHDVQELVVSRLIEQGFTVWDSEKEVILPITDSDGNYLTPPASIIGHIDGMIQPPSSLYPAAISDFQYLLEIKGFGPSYWSLWKSKGLDGFPLYKFQVSAYMYALELSDLCFVVHNKETDELDIQFYEHPPCDLWELEARVISVEELYKLFLQGDTTLLDVACSSTYPCPYYYLHTPVERAFLTPLQLQLARTYVAANAKIKELEQTKSNIAEKLLSTLPWTDDNRKFGDGEVSISIPKPREYPDMEKIKQLLVDAELDIADYTKVSDKQPAPLITVKKEK